MRGIFNLARAVRPAASVAGAACVAPSVPRSSAGVLGQLPKSSRGFATSSHRRARYDRWDPYGGQGQPNNGRNNVTSYVKRRLGGDRGVVIYAVGIGGAVIYYVYHLERVPETGRLRFMDCSVDQETEIGLATYQETMQQFGGKILSPSHPISRRVRKIATRIVESNNLGKMKSGHSLGAVEGQGWGQDLEFLFGGGKRKNDNPLLPGDLQEWEVYVVDDPKTQNAFVIPGGKIFVFTGILPVSANDDGLATVMGHEIAHVVARHGAERMSQMKVLFGVSFLLESLGLDVGFTRLLVTFLLQLPNSRTNETEADNIGLKLMARACYNPGEGPHLWERMSEVEGMRGGSNLDFMSTHPGSKKRIKALKKEEPEAMAEREKHCGAAQAAMDGGFSDTLNWARNGSSRTPWG